MTTTRVRFQFHSLLFLLTRCLDSAYIFIGGLHRDLTEGDVITIFSQ